jgi:hypothetical protein
VPLERAPTVEEVIDELRVRLTLVALRAQADGEVARVRGPSATGLGLPTVLSSRLSQRTRRHQSAAEGCRMDRGSVGVELRPIESAACQTETAISIRQ